MSKLFQKRYFKASVVFLLLVSLVFEFFPIQETKAKTLHYPEFCAPKIPYYNQPRGKSQEFYQACYLLKDIYDSAYNQVESAKKLGEFTDIFGEYGPLNKCSAGCCLGFPKCTINIDLTELLCAIFPQSCTIIIMEIKKIYDFIQPLIELYNTYRKWRAIYDAVIMVKDDVKNLYEGGMDAWLDFQNLLEASGGMNINSQTLRSFNDQLAAITSAKATTTKKITEIESRFGQMEEQIKTNLILPKLGITKDKAKDIFEENLFSSIEKIYDDDFYQKIENIKTAIFQIEYYVSTTSDNGLPTTSAAELVEKIKEAETDIEEIKLSIDEIRMVPEESSVNILPYLSSINVSASTTLEGLDNLESKLTNFPLPEELKEEFRIEIERRIASSTENISEIKLVFETITAKIETLENLSGLGIGDLAKKAEQLRKAAEANIQAQIFGYRIENSSIFPDPSDFPGISTPTSTLDLLLYKIYSSDYEENIEAIYQAASSTVVFASQSSCWENESTRSCLSCDQLKSAARQLRNSYWEVKSLLYNRFKKESPEQMAKILRYLNQLKPKIKNFLADIETIENIVNNFEFPSRMKEDCLNSIQDQLNIVSEKLNQIKPVSQGINEILENLEKIGGNIIEIAKVYGVVAKLEKLIKKAEEIKDEVEAVGIGLEISENDIRQQTQQVKSNLQELKTMEDKKTCTLSTGRPKASITQGAAQDACNRWCWPSGGTISGNFAYRNEAYHKGSFENCTVWDHDRALLGNPWFTSVGSVTCSCQNSDYLPENLSDLGIKEEYLQRTRERIDEAIATIDPLQEAAIEAMGVMNGIKALFNLASLWTKIQQLQQTYKDLKTHWQNLKDAWASTTASTPEVSPAKGSCDIKNWLNYCKDLPSRGVYGEKSPKLFIKLDTLQKQISANFARINRLYNEIADFNKTHPGAGIEIIKNKAEKIWGESMWLNTLVSVLNSNSKNCTCGKSQCKDIYCFPALADLVGWDCDYEICKMFTNHKIEKVIDETGKEINVCKIPGVKFWEGKENGKCDFPTYDVFNQKNCWLAWILSWFITNEGGPIDVLEQEITK
jgi:hypothetical protein